VEHKRPGRKAYLLITLFALLLVVFPFLFWHATWFGRSLTSQEIDSYLDNAAEKPRQAQHALVQIGERLGRGDPGARRWYPKMIAMTNSPALELRQTTAWLMGQDHAYEPFHDPLRKLLSVTAPNSDLSDLGRSLTLPLRRKQLHLHGRPRFLWVMDVV